MLEVFLNCSNEAFNISSIPAYVQLVRQLFMVAVNYFSQTNKNKNKESESKETCRLSCCLQSITQTKLNIA